MIVLVVVLIVIEVKKRRDNPDSLGLTSKTNMIHIIHDDDDDGGGGNMPTSGVVFLFQTVSQSIQTVAKYMMRRLIMSIRHVHTYRSYKKTCIMSAHHLSPVSYAFFAYKIIFHINIYIYIHGVHWVADTTHYGV